MARGWLEPCHGSSVTAWHPVTCKPRLRGILPRVNLGCWQWGVVRNVRAVSPRAKILPPRSGEPNLGP